MAEIDLYRIDRLPVMAVAYGWCPMQAVLVMQDCGLPIEDDSIERLSQDLYFHLHECALDGTLAWRVAVNLVVLDVMKTKEV